MTVVALCRGAVFAGLITMLVGCSSPAEVSGKVTYKNEPVEGGTITFASMENGVRGSAKVNADGTFSAVLVAAGKNLVQFSPPSMPAPTEPLKPGESMPQHALANLAPKPAEVDLKSGKNKMDVELVTPPPVDPSLSRKARQ